MARLVDAHERELARLPHLAVHHAVRRRDVGEARGRVARRVHVPRHHLPAHPVAVVVRVAEVHGHRDVLRQQLLHGRHGADQAVVVARVGERVAHGRVRL